MTRADANALITTTLQNLIGQGIDSASFVILMKTPGGTAKGPHRMNHIAISGTLDAQGLVSVKDGSKNPIKQPVPTALPENAAPPAPPAPATPAAT